MDFLHPRNPISAWTHGLWMLLSIPAAVQLQIRAGRSALKHLGFAVYSASLFFCFFGSWLYHTVDPSDEALDWYLRLDLIGIFLLIAGTTTPVSLVVLRGGWRVGMLAATWGMAAAGCVIRGCAIPVPDELSTGLYILMGWIGVLAYVDLARRLTHREIRPLWIGGLLYSAGGACNAAGWPVLWHPTFGYHDVLHLFVMLASGFFHVFMLRTVAPFREARALPLESAERRRVFA